MPQGTCPEGERAPGVCALLQATAELQAKRSQGSGRGFHEGLLPYPSVIYRTLGPSPLRRPFLGSSGACGCVGGHRGLPWCPGQLSPPGQVRVLVQPGSHSFFLPDSLSLAVQSSVTLLTHAVSPSTLGLPFPGGGSRGGALRCLSEQA